ncbi:MAG: hypothetical protein ACXW5U_15295 [Thermoanaerobaculia bacterium]
MTTQQKDMTGHHFEMTTQQKDMTGQQIDMTEEAIEGFLPAIDCIESETIVSPNKWAGSLPAPASPSA